MKQAQHRTTNTTRVSLAEEPGARCTEVDVEYRLPGPGGEGLAGKRFLGTDFRAGR